MVGGAASAGPAGLPAGRRPRISILAPPALALLVFCYSGQERTCVDHDTATFAVASSCGPSLLLTVSYSSAVEGCGGDCLGDLVAPGANGAGLPEQGEASGWTTNPVLGGVLLGGNFAFIGKVPVAGGTLERRCRAFPPRETLHQRVGTVLVLTCEGDVTAAFCSGTLTFQGP